MSASSSRKSRFLRLLLIAGVSAPALLAAPAMAQVVVNEGDTLELQGGMIINDTVTVSGSGTAGSGALRNLSDNNIINGAVTLAGNTLFRSDGDPDNAPVSQVVMNALNGGGHALTTTGTGRIIILGAISNLSSLTQNDGVLTLAGTNTFTGPVTVNDGFLQLLNGQALADTVALTVNTQGVIQLAASETIGSLAGGGRIVSATGPATLTVGGNNVSTTFSGSLQNGGVHVSSLAKIGTGTLTLTGANSYTGTTTINGGVLRIGAGGTSGTLGTGAVTVAAGAELSFNRSNAITVANLIQGGGLVTIGGSGPVTFSGPNTYSGLTRIQSGSTLTVTNSGALGTSAGGTSVQNGTLQLQGGITIADALTLGGNGTAGSGALRNLADVNFVTGNVTLTGNTSLRSDGVADGPSQSYLALRGDFNGGGYALTTNGTGRISIDGVLSNLESLTQNDGVLHLSGTNTFTGPVTVNGGFLQLVNGQALADTVALTVNTGAVVQLGASETIGSLAGGGRIVSALANETLTVGGNNFSTTFSGSLENGGSNVSSLAKIGAGTLTLSGANSYTGTTTISGGVLQVGAGGATGVLGTGNVTNNATLRFNRSDLLTVANAISGSGGLIQQGVGTTILSGANNYAGLTTITAGALNIRNAAALGSTAGGTVVQSGAALELEDGINVAGEVLTLNGSGVANGGGLRNVSGSNVWNGGITLASDSRIVADGSSTPGVDELVLLGTFTTNNHALSVGGTGRLTINSALDGLASLTKDGSGVVTLNGAGYSGATTINAGTLSLQANSLGASAFTVNGGGTLSLAANSTLGSLSGAGNVTGNGFSLALNNGGGFGGALSGVNELTLYSGSLALTDNASLAATLLTIQNNATLDISGISGGSLTLGRVASDGDIVLGSKTLVLTNGMFDMLTGDISGTGGVTISTGASGLLGTKSYTGITRVESTGLLGLGATLASSLSLEGQVQLIDNSTITGLSGSGLVQFTSNTVLKVTGDSDFSGSLRLNSFNSYGELNVTGGNFTLRGEASLYFIRVSGGSFTYADGATLSRDYGAGRVITSWFALDAGDLIVDRSDNVTLTEITGAGNVVKNGGGTLTLQTNVNQPGYTGATTVNAGTLVVQGGAALSDTSALTIAGGTHVRFDAGETIGDLRGAGTLDNGGHLLTVANAGGGGFAGVISGSGGLALTGGSLILTGGNAFTGVTTVANATLQLGDGGATGSVNGPITLASGGLVVNRSDEIAITNLSGVGDFVQHGLGTTRLSNVSGLSGGIFVNHGTLALVGTSVSGAAMTLSGGTLDLSSAEGGVAGFARLAGNGNGVIQLGATNLTVGDASSTTFGGVISGTGGLIKVGGGVLTLTGANSYTGLTEVREGTLRFGANEVLSDDSTLSVLNGATLDLQAFNETVGSFSIQGNLIGTGILTAGYYRFYGGTIAQTLGAGTVYQISGTTLLQSGSGAASVYVQGGALALGADERLSNSAMVDVSAGATLDLGVFDETVRTLKLNGRLDGAGTLTAANYVLTGATVNGNLGTGALSQAGGVSLLNGSASAQTVAVDEGTLRLGAANRLADNASLTVAGGATLDLQGFNETVGSLALSGTLAGTGTLSAGSYTLTGATVNANLGAGALVQAGGASTLNGDFAGSAGVSGGSLTVGGRIGGDVAVNQGTLTGTGDIVGAVTVANGGRLAGAQGSTLSMGSLVLNTGSIVEVSLSQPASDALFDVGGDLTLDGTLNVATAPNFGVGVYRLFDYGGVLTDNGLALGTVNGQAPTGLSVQTAAAGQVNLVNVEGATLAFWDGGDATLHDNGVIDGGGGVWGAAGRNWTLQAGAVNGPMTPTPSFAVFQGQGGAVTIDNGAGQVSATGMQFASDGYTLGGGALALSGERATIRVGDGTAAGAAFTAAIASPLTGASTLVKTDLGTLVLTGANTYGGGTVIEAGTLIGNADSIRGNVANAGALIFDQAIDGTYGGSVTGVGSVTKSGAGALTLAGVNATEWTVTGGKLISTSSLFRGDVALGLGTSLVFDQTGDSDYAGVISGTGQVVVQGGGMVRLTGDSSGFFGTTTVSSGFSVNGKLGGLLDVLADGRLQGVGTIGSARIAGTIAPGNSIGTLNVGGNLSFVSGSIFEVEANAAGESDKIVVGGSVTIAAGSTVSVLAANGNYSGNTNYTILTTVGGVSGVFSDVTSNLAFLTPTLSYSATAVTLNLRRNTIDFAAVAQTRNQLAVSPAIEALGMGDAVYDAVVVLTVPEARAAFDQLAGSDHASLRGQLVEDSRFMREAMLSRSQLGGAEGVSLWVRAIGSESTTDGNVEAQGYDRSIEGFVTGIDRSFGANWRAGVALSYGDSELRTDNATHNADSYSLGGYALGSYGALRVQLGGAYGWTDIRSHRSVAFGGLDEVLTDKHDAQVLQLFGELGANAHLGSLELQPFAGVAYVKLFDGSFAEQGGAAALSGGKDGFAVTYGNVGARAKLSMDLGENRLRFAGSAAVRQTLDDNVPTIALRFAGGATFQIEGAPLDRTSAVIDAGVELDMGEFITLGVSYNGAHGDRTSDHGARASVSVRF